MLECLPFSTLHLPMSSLFFWLLLAAVTIFFIWLLRRNQHSRARESAELNTPLPRLDQSVLPDLRRAPQTEASPPGPASAPVADTSPTTSFAPELPQDSSPVTPYDTPGSALASTENWLHRVRILRENDQLDAALTLCRTHYPRSQAFQQAAVILRQQIRDCIEQKLPAAQLLRELYRTAALADLFRGGSHWKPLDPQVALAQLDDTDFSYANLGHQYLRLLNKSDVRALEQLWGHPATHRHSEELLGEDWRTLCTKPGPPN
jgi:hypothetical protein